MSEFLVVMDRTATPEQYNEAVGLIAAQGGRVNLRFPPSVILAEGDSQLRTAVRHVQGVRHVYTSGVSNPSRLGLNEAGLLAIEAWNQRTSEEYRAAKAARPDDGKAWDFHDARPGGDVIPVEDAPGPTAMAALSAKSAPVNTSRYMVGSVAVGVVIVDGPAGSTTAFTAAERANVVAEVQEGTNNLIGLSPAGANLNFVFDVHTVTLTLAPAVVSGETDWRNPAMATLGYSSGSSGMYDYLHDMRTTTWPAMCPGPDWAYVAFFTKYAASWFAYASLGGPRVVMQYDNNGWGPNQIDRVFAHETGHIFHAPDEYAASGCTLGGSWGYLGVANDNCANGNPASIDCLMKANTYSVCDSTVGHFGWRDTDTDGIPDPIDLAPGTYASDVGINPGSPFYNNSDLWMRRLDDGEANPTHQNPLSSQDNWIYAKVRNFGSVTAEAVRTRFYLANFTGTEFVFPTDYTNLITAPDTPCPTVFSLTSGASAVSKVRLRQTQIPPSSWHPCLLVHVACAQEAAVAAGSHAWDTNNLAQKNLVIDYVAPSQTLHLPIVLQNITAEQPVFELKRLDMPRNVGLQMQFRDKRIWPEIVREPHILEPIILRPPVIHERLRRRMVTEPLRGTSPADEQSGGGFSFQFLDDTDLALYHGGELQDIFLHMASGSAVSMRGAVERTEEPEDEVALAAYEKWNRVFFPVPVNRITRFELPIHRQTRKTAGISITAPADANIGDEYHFELVQYNDQGKATGGIAFAVRVVSRIFTLREFMWRIAVLRRLGLQVGSDKFGDLADVAESLMDVHLSASAGAAADAAPARTNFASVLKEAAIPELWGYPVGSLAETAQSLAAAPSFAADLDALSLLLFHGQERLLADDSA